MGFPPYHCFPQKEPRSPVPRRGFFFGFSAKLGRGRIGLIGLVGCASLPSPHSLLMMYPLAPTPLPGLLFFTVDDWTRATTIGFSRRPGSQGHPYTGICLRRRSHRNSKLQGTPTLSQAGNYGQSGLDTARSTCRRHRDLNRSATNIPSAHRIANIALNDAMILPYDANPGRMEFSERTGD
jgi:hypothetical protein